MAVHSSKVVPLPVWVAPRTVRTYPGSIYPRTKYGRGLDSRRRAAQQGGVVLMEIEFPSSGRLVELEAATEVLNRFHCVCSSSEVCRW